MVVTIHQPEHLPWLGLIDKIAKADVFVILDTVQFEKNYFQNRNKVRTNSEKGFSWLTVPIKKHRLDTPINKIEISYEQNWTTRVINILKENYRKACYFDVYTSLLGRIVEERYSLLSELNTVLLREILNEFNVRTETVLASDLGIVPDQPGGNEVIMDICKKTGASTYIAGVGGRNYLKTGWFRAEGVNVKFHEFQHPSYDQQYQPFMTHMSSIDLLINHGPGMSRDILFSGGAAEGDCEG